jgi:hypothetical protein
MDLQFRKACAVAIFCLFILAAAGFWLRGPATEVTRLELTESETGRVIFSSLLRDGEEAVLQWRNSLFALDVTEIFQSRSGVMVLDRVTFADPRGTPPPEVAPSDVDDLYHTGGPFTAGGLGRPFRRVVYRIGEIGNPTLKIRDRTVNFKNEAGFGGSVLLAAALPSRFEVLKESLGAIPASRRERSTDAGHTSAAASVKP